MSERHDRPDADDPAGADDGLPPLPEPMLGSDEDGAPEFGLDDAPARSPFLANLEARDDEPEMAASLPAFDDDAPTETMSADAGFGDDAEVPAFAAALSDGDAPADDMQADEAPAGALAVSEDGDSSHEPIVETTGRMRRVWQEIRYVAIKQEKPEFVAPPPVIDEAGRTIRKYLFEKSFDIVEAPPEPEPEPEPIVEEPPPIEVIAEEPPPPVFSEEQLAATRAEGYAEGEQAARQAAASATETHIATLLQQLGGIIPDLVADRDHAINAVSQEAARLAHAMVRRLMPELARRYRIEELEAVVIDSIDKALDQPRIIIRVPNDVVAYLGDRLETVGRQYGFAGRVIVLADPALGPSDVRVEWGDGGAERCVQRAWNDIEAVVGRVVEKLEQVAPVAEVPSGTPGDTIGSAA